MAQNKDARHTEHTSYTAQQKREAVMTDDGSQPPIEQLATAAHRGPATRSWCGPLLLVLLGGVVKLLVFCACRLMSIFLMSFGGETQNIGTINTVVEVLTFNPNDPYISVHSERGSVTHNSSRERYV